jgi:hypothetical protein
LRDGGARNTVAQRFRRRGYLEFSRKNLYAAITT